MIIVVGNSGFIGKSFIKYVQDNYPGTNIVGISGRNIEELTKLSSRFFGHITVVMCLGNELQYYKNLPYQEPTIFEQNYLSKIVTILNCENLRLIYLSSAGTIYKINGEQKCTEDSKLAPTSNYGMYKYHMENFLLNNFSSKVCKLIILRVSNVYGELQKPNKGQGIISTLINNMLRNEEVIIFNNGLERKDYLYIDDLSRALYLASKSSSSILEEIYNISSGNSYSVKQIIEYLIEIMNKMQISINLDLFVYKGVSDLDQLKNSFIDSNKFQKEFTWDPMIDLESGLNRVIQYQKRTVCGN
jgi:UDP-glucose 4-epimerase